MVPTYHTLSWVLVMVAGCIGEGRVRGPACQYAMLMHMMRVLEDGVLRDGHDLSPCFPLLGLPDPVLGQEVGLAPIERSVLAAYHRDRAAVSSAIGGAVRGRAAGGGGSGDAAAGPPSLGQAAAKAKPKPKPLRDNAKASPAAKAAAAAKQAQRGASGGAGDG